MTRRRPDAPLPDLSDRFVVGPGAVRDVTLFSDDVAEVIDLMWSMFDEIQLRHAFATKTYDRRQADALVADLLRAAPSGPTELLGRARSGMRAFVRFDPLDGVRALASGRIEASDVDQCQVYGFVEVVLRKLERRVDRRRAWIRSHTFLLGAASVIPFPSMLTLGAGRPVLAMAGALGSFGLHQLYVTRRRPLRLTWRRRADRLDVEQAERSAFRTAVAHVALGVASAYVGAAAAPTPTLELPPTTTSSTTPIGNGDG